MTFTYNASVMLWKCAGHRADGYGATQAEAYADWQRKDADARWSA